MEREPDQHRITISSAKEATIFAHGQFHAKVAGEVTGLVDFRRTSRPAQYLLKRDYIRSDCVQDGQDAVRSDTTIHTATLVDVVGDHSQAHRYCSLVRAHPSGSWSRSRRGRLRHCSSVTSREAAKSASKS